MELTPDWPPPSPPSGSSRAAQHNSNTTTTGAAATPPPPSRKPASKRRLAVLSHPPLPSASFPPSHSFTFHSLPFTSLLPPRRKRRDERGRGGGWRERTKGSEGYILCPLGFVPREENHHPSILLSLCSYSFLFYHRAYFVSLSITGTWMDKQRNADQFEYRELGYPLFEIFAKALSLSPSLLLVSIYISLSLSDPARFDQEALLFSTYSWTPVFEINPDFRRNCCRWKATEFFVVFRVSGIDRVAPRKVFRLLDHLFFHFYFEGEEIHPFF